MVQNDFHHLYVPRETLRFTAKVTRQKQEEVGDTEYRLRCGVTGQKQEEVGDTEYRLRCEDTEYCIVY